MKTWPHLFLILIASSLLSCNEKISEEIQNQATAAPSSGGGSGSTVSETLSIRVVNNKDPIFSYIMHKAGSVEEACEIQAPAGGFNAATYNNNDPNTVIDCVLDAEEYDLYFEGIDLDVQVDANLCEYVEYTPFKYFQWQPGVTQRDVHKVECDDICAAANPAICNKVFASGDGVSYTDEIIGDGSSASICSFDYSDEENFDGSKQGPNCDSGSFEEKTYTYSSGDHDDDPLTADACLGLTAESTFQNQPCSGDLKACYGGGSFPDKLELDKTVLITQNLSLDELTVDVSVDSPFNQGFDTNLSIANFSRTCSSTSNTKVNSAFDIALIDIIGNEVEEITSSSNFVPTVVDLFEDGKPDHTIYANHPFDGVATKLSPSADISPYYSIKCLDSARDIKAQIRVFVREWDRNLETDNLFLSRLSDINQGVSARMDASGDQSAGNPWNDFLDWDDHLADRDLNATIDSNPNDNGGALDPIFINNQCRDINTGYCFDSLTGATDTAFTNQTDCAAASADHNWVPSRESFPEFRD